MSNKNLLQEYCIKHFSKLPSYDTIQKGPPHAPYFECTVTIGNDVWTSDKSNKKIDAEQNAAGKAIGHFKEKEKNIEVNDNFKNLLQEKLQKLGEIIPTYSSFNKGDGRLFYSKVKFDLKGKKYEFETENGFSKIKQSEQNAAYVALKALKFLKGKELLVIKRDIEDESTNKVIHTKQERFIFINPFGYSEELLKQFEFITTRLKSLSSLQMNPKKKVVLTFYKNRLSIKQKFLMDILIKSNKKRVIFSQSIDEILKWPECDVLLCSTDNFYSAIQINSGLVENINTLIIDYTDLVYNLSNIQEKIEIIKNFNNITVAFFLNVTILQSEEINVQVKYLQSKYSVDCIFLDVEKKYFKNFSLQETNFYSDLSTKELNEEIKKKNLLFTEINKCFDSNLAKKLIKFYEYFGFNEWKNEMSEFMDKMLIDFPYIEDIKWQSKLDLLIHQVKNLKLEKTTGKIIIILPNYYSYKTEQILKTKFPRLITKTISLEDIENYRNSIFNIGLIETKLLNNINLPLNYEHVFHLNFKKIESIIHHRVLFENSNFMAIGTKEELALYLQLITKEDSFFFFKKNYNK